MRLTSMVSGWPARVTSRPPHPAPQAVRFGTAHRPGGCGAVGPQAGIGHVTDGVSPPRRHPRRAGFTAPSRSLFGDGTGMAPSGKGHPAVPGRQPVAVWLTDPQ
jgi:hypothetical protein